MTRRRFTGAAVIFGLAFAVVLVRAVHLCVVSAEAFGPQAMRQALRDLELVGPRGDIVDRAGAPLAVSALVPSLYARPRAIEDRSRLAERLSAALGTPFEAVFPALTGDRAFVWVKRWLSPEEAARVRALNERGIGLLQEPRRYYPGRELAAHVLGFVGHDRRGLAGLERAFDRTLRGHPLTLKSLRDARGRHFLLRGGVRPPATAGAGRSLQLTLDRGVQYLATQALERAARAAQAKGGSAVVLDPITGEVYALASYPAFNPNAFGGAEPRARRTRPIADVFEPGSTMKVFTIAIALEAGKLSLRDRLYCERGRWRVGEHVITDIHGRGFLNPAEILKYSSNICAAKVGLRVGRERLREGLRRFGFGRAPGLPLPGEVAGVLHPARQWRRSHVVTHSYGYGLSVSAVQLAIAYAAIANGGEVLRPRLVRAVLERDGTVLQRFPRESRGRAISTRTATTLTKLMVGVTSPSGTGRRAAIAGYEVAGKTGTAMKVSPHGGYSSTRRVVSFAGFVPAWSPRLVAVVVLDEPAGRAMGGSVAAPAWKEIAEGTLRLWGVPATAPLRVEKVPKRPPVAARPKHRTPRVIPGVVPDLRGLGVMTALRAVTRVGMGLEVLGSGRAIRQKPPAGAPALAGAAVRVVFAREDG